MTQTRRTVSNGMSESASYCFDDFVTDLEMITSAGTDQTEMIGKISRKMKIITAGENFLTAQEQEADLKHYARHLVYIDRQRRFVIMSGVWQPGQGTPVHDHGTWGVMGIYTGELKVTNYLRLDDRTRPGYAKLREATGSWQGPGSVSYVLPPNEELHKVENLSEAPTLTLHVYGRDIIECNMYDLKTNEVRPYSVDYVNAGKDR